MQVVLDNGVVSNDLKTVLKKWQTEFCNLLNVEPLSSNVDSTDNLTDQPACCNDFLDCNTYYYSRGYEGCR